MPADTRITTRWRLAFARSRRPIIVVAIVIAFVWIIPVVLPSDSGWRLGLPFRLFYTVIALLGGLFFILVQSPATPSRQTATGWALVTKISAVYVVSVGLLVGIGAVFPNFDTPTEAVSAGETAAERGEALFFDSATSCILCHAVSGQGGTRGPDLEGVATRAGERVTGLTAEEYLRQSILEPTAFIVDPFDPIMPPNLINVVGEENFDDLIAFLMTLE